MVETDPKLAALLKLIDLPNESHVQIRGTDPVIPSRFGIGRAAATALAILPRAAQWPRWSGERNRVVVIM